MQQTERLTQNILLSHESLDVYHLALQFHVGVMTLLPEKGQRNLRDQLERASLSIVLNIAEGAGRCTPPERRRHFIIALGSVYECAAILDVLRLRQLASLDRCARARDYAVRIAQSRYLEGRLRRVHKSD
jgi:four helix bundle protein